jgi:hypothetical protein
VIRTYRECWGIVPKFWSPSTSDWSYSSGVGLIPDLPCDLDEALFARPSKETFLGYHLRPSAGEGDLRNNIPRIVDSGLEVYELGGYRNQVHIVEGRIEVSSEFGTFVNEGLRLSVEYATEFGYKNFITKNLMDVRPNPCRRASSQLTVRTRYSAPATSSSNAPKTL